MPIRLVCPSCSAALSVKDEYAGRAVKCPKCGGVIPASQPGAAAPAPSKPAMPALPPPPAPPEPAPAPSSNPFEALDEPEKPKPKITARATAKPAAKAADPEDDDEVAKPAKKKGRDEDDRDDEPVAKKSKRRGDDEDDRPARKKRRGDDDEDDDDRGGKKKKGGSNALMIVAVICGTLLLCCGGSGFGVYYYIIKPVKEKVQETVQKAEEEVKTWNFQVSKFSYDELEVGESTRSVADAKLGSGRVATDADLQKVFASEPGRVNDWTPKVTAKRAVVWQNGQDYVIAAFHPNADGTGRLQAKEWRPKSGGALKEGELDDAKFLKDFPVGGGAGTPVTATELAEAYKAGNGTIGDPKYKGKWLMVEGKVKEIDFDYSTPANLRIVFEGVKKADGGTVDARVTLAKTDIKKGLALSPGQNVKLKGKCKGYSFLSVDLENGTVSSFDPDPNPSVTAAALIAEYAKDKDMTDEKYSTKFLTVTDGTIESVSGDNLVIRGGPAKGGATKLQVSLRSDENFRKAVGTLRAGMRVKVKGTYSQFGGNPNVNLSYAWVVPE